MIRKIFITSLVLLLPTVATAQNLELCKILEQHCREIEIFSKQNKEDNSDIIKMCKARVDACKDDLKEITKDPSVKDFVKYSEDLKDLQKEIDEQVGETREGMLGAGGEEEEE